MRENGTRTWTMPSAPATSHKGRNEAEKEQGPVVKFSALKLFKAGYGEGI